ncbi:serine/threonine-protein phosphatase 6 regulatory ankyrin repeat subunit A-like, partial [Centruroides sculpturatus]|uniref:serine/threonine-protein phosphatase 6 regulatory ankyrin repeat subunit A-like n=1 Tax=Centruroides sculpturatus TaxID=218467 RepID=UPI000C6E627C
PPLVQAVFKGDINEVQELLFNREEVNYQDSERRSILHAAAFCGHAEISDLLLLSSARVNTKDNHWVTPLHRACCSQSETKLEEKNHPGAGFKPATATYCANELPVTLLRTSVCLLFQYIYHYDINIISYYGADWESIQCPHL